MDLIVAVDKNWGIGKGGTQTVVIPEDRKYFRELTDGATVIVGHRTLLDFPEKRPLPGRKNIVLSRSKDLRIEGATVVTSLDELFRTIEGTDPDKVFVIGGDSVFKMLLPYCRFAYVTKIEADPESDAFFPNLDVSENWTVDRTGELKMYGDISYSFMRYKNVAPLDIK